MGAKFYGHGIREVGCPMPAGRIGYNRKFNSGLDLD